jgi:hypothetical protein
MRLHLPNHEVAGAEWVEVTRSQPELAQVGSCMLMLALIVGMILPLFSWNRSLFSHRHPLYLP